MAARLGTTPFEIAVETHYDAAVNELGAEHWDAAIGHLEGIVATIDGHRTALYETARNSGTPWPYYSDAADATFLLNLTDRYAIAQPRTARLWMRSKHVASVFDMENRGARLPFTKAWPWHAPSDAPVVAGAPYDVERMLPLGGLTTALYYFFDLTNAAILAAAGLADGIAAAASRIVAALDAWIHISRRTVVPRGVLSGSKYVKVSRGRPSDPSKKMNGSSLYAEMYGGSVPAGARRLHMPMGAWTAGAPTERANSLKTLKNATQAKPFKQWNWVNVDGRQWVLPSALLMMPYVVRARLFEFSNVEVFGKVTVHDSPELRHLALVDAHLHGLLLTDVPNMHVHPFFDPEFRTAAAPKTTSIKTVTYEQSAAPTLSKSTNAHRISFSKVVNAERVRLVNVVVDATALARIGSFRSLKTLELTGVRVALGGDEAPRLLTQVQFDAAFAASPTFEQLRSATIKNAPDVTDVSKLLALAPNLSVAHVSGTAVPTAEASPGRAAVMNALEPTKPVAKRPAAKATKKPTEKRPTEKRPAKKPAGRGPTRAGSSSIVESEATDLKRAVARVLSDIATMHGEHSKALEDRSFALALADHEIRDAKRSTDLAARFDADSEERREANEDAAMHLAAHADALERVRVADSQTEVVASKLNAAQDDAEDLHERSSQLIASVASSAAAEGARGADDIDRFAKALRSEAEARRTEIERLSDEEARLIELIAGLQRAIDRIASGAVEEVHAGHLATLREKLAVAKTSLADARKGVARIVDDPRRLPFEGIVGDLATLRVRLAAAEKLRPADVATARTAALPHPLRRTAEEPLPEWARTAAAAITSNAELGSDETGEVATAAVFDEAQSERRRLYAGWCEDAVRWLAGPEGIAGVDLTPSFLDSTAKNVDADRPAEEHRFVPVAAGAAEEIAEIARNRNEHPAKFVKRWDADAQEIVWTYELLSVRDAKRFAELSATDQKFHADVSQSISAGADAKMPAFSNTELMAPVAPVVGQASKHEPLRLTWEDGFEVGEVISTKPTIKTRVDYRRPGWLGRFRSEDDPMDVAPAGDDDSLNEDDEDDPADLLLPYATATVHKRRVRLSPAGKHPGLVVTAVTSVEFRVSFEGALHLIGFAALAAIVSFRDTRFESTGGNALYGRVVAAADGTFVTRNPVQHLLGTLEIGEFSAHKKHALDASGYEGIAGQRLRVIPTGLHEVAAERPTFEELSEGKKKLDPGARGGEGEGEEGEGKPGRTGPTTRRQRALQRRRVVRTGRAERDPIVRFSRRLFTVEFDVRDDSPAGEAFPAEEVDIGAFWNVHRLLQTMDDYGMARLLAEALVEGEGHVLTEAAIERKIRSISDSAVMHVRRRSLEEEFNDFLLVFVLGLGLEALASKLERAAANELSPNPHAGRVARLVRFVLIGTYRPDFMARIVAIDPLLDADADAVTLEEIDVPPTPQELAEMEEFEVSEAPVGWRDLARDEEEEEDPMAIDWLTDDGDDAEDEEVRFAMLRQTLDEGANQFGDAIRDELTAEEKDVTRALNRAAASGAASSNVRDELFQLVERLIQARSVLTGAFVFFHADLFSDRREIASALMRELQETLGRHWAAGNADAIMVRAEPHLRRLIAEHLSGPSRNSFSRASRDRLRRRSESGTNDPATPSDAVEHLIGAFLDLHRMLEAFAVLKFVVMNAAGEAMSEAAVTGLNQLVAQIARDGFLTRSWMWQDRVSTGVLFGSIEEEPELTETGAVRSTASLGGGHSATEPTLKRGLADAFAEEDAAMEEALRRSKKPRIKSLIAGRNGDGDGDSNGEDARETFWRRAYRRRYARPRGEFSEERIGEIACAHCCAGIDAELQPTAGTCVGCDAVHYCDEACQLADWTRHEPECDELRR